MQAASWTPTRTNKLVVSRKSVIPRRRWNPKKLAGNMGIAVITVAVEVVLGLMFLAWWGRCLGVVD